MILALLILLVTLAVPIQVRGETPVMAGVAGPAVNLVYAYLAQDAGLWRKHGLDVRAVADGIGAAKLDEILNEQFERTKGTPAAGVLNVEKALLAQHGIDLQAMAMKARFEKKNAKS